MNNITAAQEKQIFQQKISPLMDQFRRKYPDIGMDMFFVSVVSQLKKSNIQLSNNIVNMMLDKMARDSVPKSSWQYIKNKVVDGNLIKTVFDMTHPSARKTALEEEVMRRAEIMYNPSTLERIGASVGVGTADVLATAPVAVLCPQSVVYGYLVQGGYDVVNNHILIPESKEERKQQSNSAIQHITALNDQADGNHIPGWMMAKCGASDVTKASDGKLKIAAKWADSNKTLWEGIAKKFNANTKVISVNGKNFAQYECQVKANQYGLFSELCHGEINRREQAQKAAQAEALRQQRELESQQAKDENSESDTLSEVQSSENKSDSWGDLLKGLGFNGLGNIGRHLGYTLATLPDMIFNMFSGKSSTTGFDSGTLIPLASLFIGNKINNPMLKVALMGYGGLNLVNRLGNESLSKAQGTNLGKSDSANVQYKRYADEELNSRITNVQIKSNRLFADIDRTPCSVTLSETIVNAYQSGSLPLNTLANAILQRNDAASQNVSQNYEQSQTREVSKGIR